MEKHYLSWPFIKSLSWLLILSVIFVFSMPTQSWSQCNTGSTICETSAQIDLPFTGRMSEENGSNIGNPIPGCNGNGIFHNSTWYMIIPTSTSLLIQVVGSNCTDQGAGPGLQAALFSACDVNAPPVGGFVQCDCVGPGLGISLGGEVTPGEPLFLLLDGCGGSTCDVEITLLEGTIEEAPISGPGPLGIPEIPFSQLAEICPGGIISFSVPPVMNADDYTWELPAGATIISQSCRSINVEWGATAGNVSVSVTNTTSGETQNSPPLFIELIELEYSLEASYCGSSASGFLFSGDNMLYAAGSYVIQVPGSNCDTLVNLTVTDTQPILTLSGSGQTCENEGMATVTATGGVPPLSYLWSNSNGATTPTIDNLISGDYIVTVTGADGCSSEGLITIGGVFDLAVNSTPTDCDEANGMAYVTTTGEISNPAYAWNNGATDSLITELSPGFYSVTVTDTETNCQTHENVEVVEDPECSVRISGTVFLNLVDPDCQTDTTSVPFPFVQIILSDGQIVFTDQNGFYEFTGDAGDYTVFANSAFPTFELLCFDSLEVAALDLGTDYLDNNFYFTAAPHGDLVVKLVKPNARPGFEQRPRVCLMNVGTEILSGTLTLEFPLEQNFVSADPPEDLYDETNQTLTWDFVDLPPGAVWIYRPVLLLPVGTPLGTPLTYTGSTNGNHVEETPEDNTTTCTILATGSYDPNDKAVNPIGEGEEGFIEPTDTTLSYTVRFQNTGTDTAFTVLIRDTLSAEVDVRSLRPGPASHNYTAKIVDGNVLELLFENIMLPDSFVNEPASNGFVIFDVNLLPGRTAGTVIENRAAIFFDFNQPIITNEVTNTIKQLVATTLPASPLTLQLAPNPVHTTSMLSFELLEAENIEIKIYDLLGNLQENLVLRKSYPAGKHRFEINTEEYAAGLYFITLKTDKDQIATVKMIRL